jgi:hypothetical protein
VKPKIRAFFFVAVFSILAYGVALSSELRIVPLAGSGLTREKLSGARLTLKGHTEALGTLNAEGVVVDAGGRAVDLSPGDYAATLTLSGYSPVSVDFTVPEPVEGLPVMPVEREVSPTPLPAVPVGGGGGGPISGRGPAIGGEGLWEYLTVFLLVAIGILAVAIAVVMRRRSAAQAGGAAIDPPATASKPSRKKTTEIAPEAYEAEGPSTLGMRFTGKRFGRYTVTRSIARGCLA